MHRVHADKHYAPVPLPRRAKSRAPVRDFRARGTLRLVELQVAIAESLQVVVDVDRCGLCDGAIDRFDRPVFEAHISCCGCQGVLGD